MRARNQVSSPKESSLLLVPSSAFTLARYLKLPRRFVGHRFTPLRLVPLPPREPPLAPQPATPTMPKAAAGYYAVAKGFNPGIYGTWDACESQVTGFPGSRHKKFKTEAEAAQWLQTNGVPSPIVQTRAPAATPASAASTSRASRMASQKTPRFSPMAAAPPKGKAKASGSLLGKDVIEDTTGWKIVYCDGACRGNGKTAAVAGVGVWWGPGDPRNIAERCPGDQTNNRAELIAIVRILETVPRTTDPLLIRTDSSYSIRCLKEWLKNWRARGYKTSDGKPVKNLGVILYADALLQERKLNGQRVHFEYVKGHAGDAGNEAADYQANLGCERPIEPERDWTALEKVVRERMQKPSGQASKFFEPSATAATTGAAPAPTMSRAEVEDLAQYMTEDPTADLSD